MEIPELISLLKLIISIQELILIPELIPILDSEIGLGVNFAYCSGIGSGIGSGIVFGIGIDSSIGICSKIDYEHGIGIG